MANISNKVNPTLTGYINTAASKQAKKLATTLEQLIELRRQSEDKETELKVCLKNILKPAYFKYNEDARDVTEVEHTFDLENLQVNFTTSYFIKDSAHLQTIVELLGAEHPLVDTIKEFTRVSVDVTDLTQEEANELAASIATLTADYGITPQVERQAVASQEFHDNRHVLLSPEDNLELDTVLPLVIQVTPIE